MASYGPKSKAQTCHQALSAHNLSTLPVTFPEKRVSYGIPLQLCKELSEEEVTVGCQQSQLPRLKGHGGLKAGS